MLSLSTAWRSEHRRSLKDLIYTRFEHFLTTFIISASVFIIIIIISVTLIIPIIAPSVDTSLSQVAVQGMTAVIFGVVGFYFGNRGAERAEE